MWGCYTCAYHADTLSGRAMNCLNSDNPLPASGVRCPNCGTISPDPATDDDPPRSQVIAEAGESSSRRGAVIVVGIAVLVVAVIGTVLAMDNNGEAQPAKEAAAETESGGAPDASGVESETTEVEPDVPSEPDAPLPATVDGTLAFYDSTDVDLAIGQMSPSVFGSDFRGNGVEIEDNGRPKVILFLAHWCPHCQREVPAVQDYLNQYGLAEGVEFISVATAIDETRPNYPPDAWLESEGWTAPLIVDTDGSVGEAFGLTAFPYYVFVRKDFTVDFRIAGELDPGSVFEYAELLLSDVGEPPTVEQGPSDYAAAAIQPTACGGTAPPAPGRLSFTEPGAGPSASVLTFETSCGPISILLDSAAAPETINSMLFLASEGYFEGTIRHRLVADFVLQCGDPTGTGRGGPGYQLSDEFPESSDVYVPGTVAMANAGPGTTGS